MAHVGVLLALSEAGIHPAAAAGTSFGAIIAALYALGVPPAEMVRLLLRPGASQVWTQALDPGFGQLSVVRGRRLERWLDSSLYHGASFTDLAMPLAVATTSLEDGELELVRSGSLARAVVASCSLPLLFAPVQVSGKWLVDGGFVEAVPFSAALRLGPGALLGINTGIDTERAGMVRLLRRLRQYGWARQVADWSVARPTGSAAGRAARGLGWAARSYARPQSIPPGAVLLRLNPGIAWWDFHRMQLAVEAGLSAGRHALGNGLAAQLEPAAVALEVNDGQPGLLAADRLE